jgi:hypothetical protein
MRPDGLAWLQKGPGATVGEDAMAQRERACGRTGRVEGIVAGGRDE